LKIIIFIQKKINVSFSVCFSCHKLRLFTWLYLSTTYSFDLY
jgi:hypothetical protein